MHNVDIFTSLNKIDKINWAIRSMDAKSEWKTLEKYLMGMDITINGTRYDEFIRFIIMTLSRVIFYYLELMLGNKEIFMYRMNYELNDIKIETLLYAEIGLKMLIFMCWCFKGESIPSKLPTTKLQKIPSKFKVLEHDSILKSSYSFFYHGEEDNPFHRDLHVEWIPISCPFWIFMFF